MREAGILLGVSSLPSRFGIGCFDRAAYEFVDALASAGQKLWQILPIGPTSYGDSPYQAFSTFAGNPYFISLEDLIERRRDWERIPDPLTTESSMRNAESFCGPHFQGAALPAAKTMRLL